MCGFKAFRLSLISDAKIVFFKSEIIYQDKYILLFVILCFCSTGLPYFRCLICENDFSISHKFMVFSILLTSRLDNQMF